MPEAKHTVSDPTKVHCHLENAALF